MRWKIEVFHKILKSGCKAEESKLRTAERLANLMAVFCILSWRVLWLTMLNRIAPEASPKLVLTDTEIAMLGRLIISAPAIDKVALELLHFILQNVHDWVATWLAIRHPEM